VPINCPTAAELTDAVREFLKADVLPLLGGGDAAGDAARHRYHLLVTLNALSIVARELSLGPALDAAERERLTALVGPGGTLADANRRLCARIRAREMSHRDPALLDHLLKTTMGKMSIDNPRYATYLAALAARPEEHARTSVGPAPPSK
jgi:hypothetical protein